MHCTGDHRVLENHRRSEEEVCRVRPWRPRCSFRRALGPRSRLPRPQPFQHQRCSRGLRRTAGSRQVGRAESQRAAESSPHSAPGRRSSPPRQQRGSGSSCSHRDTRLRVLRQVKAGWRGTGEQSRPQLPQSGPSLRREQSTRSGGSPLTASPLPEWDRPAARGRRTQLPCSVSRRPAAPPSPWPRCLASGMTRGCPSCSSMQSPSISISTRSERLLRCAKPWFRRVITCR